MSMSYTTGAPRGKFIWYSYPTKFILSTILISTKREWTTDFMYRFQCRFIYSFNNVGYFRPYNKDK